MSAQHTPGKWTFGFGNVLEHVGEEFFAVGIEGETWKPIALLSKSEAITEEDRSNARLIAAAPDLLAAVRALMGAICHGGSHAETCHECRVVVAAQAAVAKATGSAS